jgi:hypothetical protein
MVSDGVTQSEIPMKIPVNPSIRFTSDYGAMCEGQTNAKYMNTIAEMPKICSSLGSKRKRLSTVPTTLTGIQTNLWLSDD